MNVDRECKNQSPWLFWSAGLYIFKSGVLFIYSLIFWLLFLQVVTEAWCCICDMLCPAWGAGSLSRFLHLLWWSYYIWTALVSFRVEATETWTVFMALFWRNWASEESKKERIRGIGEPEQLLSVAVAYGGRAGLKRKTHRLTFSSIVDRSSVRSEMGMLGCSIFVFALFFQCHSHSIQNPMYRFKR